MNMEKARAVIYGLAIGDILGRQTEFLSLPRIKATFGPEGILDLPEPALFTDVTLMIIEKLLFGELIPMGTPIPLPALQVLSVGLIWG